MEFGVTTLARGLDMSSFFHQLRQILYHLVNGYQRTQRLTRQFNFFLFLLFPACRAGMTGHERTPIQTGLERRPFDRKEQSQR